jgi:ATP-dependent DNA ligase
MSLPIPIDLEAMEAELKPELPAGPEWMYEPKWDGFRCLVFKEGDEIEIQSKAGKPLARYFPDVVEIVRGLPDRSFVLDGEIVIPVGGSLSFDDLLLRIHPAASRVQKLAAATPAMIIAFDLLADSSGKLLDKPLEDRRRALEEFAGGNFTKGSGVRLSPSTDDVKLAAQWLAASRGGLDGVMAKRRDLPYQAGNREGMVKVKRMRTAECVVGGFRWGKSGDKLGSLLLGLYGADGKLHHVGFCSALNAAIRAEAEERILPLSGGEGFSGNAPQTQSRWRQEGSGEWIPVSPEIVVEVQYDHFSGGRFRHGTRFLRWRPDKAPSACLLEQLEKEGASALQMV